MALGRTIVPYELDQEKVIVVSKVPAWVCDRCGESFVEMEVVRDLEHVVREDRAGGIEFWHRGVPKGGLKIHESLNKPEVGWRKPLSLRSSRSSWFKSGSSF
jgi:YgiT-type zinc finger domain-containing protein